MSKEKVTRVVLVTGASSGIGKATAIKFAEMGDKVYGMALQEYNLENIVCLQGDITNQDDVERCVNYVREKEGHIDVLLNIAGFGISGSVEFCSLDSIQKQMDVNFMGAVRMTKAVLPIMREQKGGSSSTSPPLLVRFSLCHIKRFMRPARLRLKCLRIRLGSK